MKIALLTHPTARDPACILDVRDATQLRHGLALAPASGYVLAVEVQDPIARSAEWRCVPKLNDDGSLRLASYLTVRGGIGSGRDCGTVWTAALATADYWREHGRQMRGFLNWVRQ